MRRLSSCINSACMYMKLYYILQCVFLFIINIHDLIGQARNEPSNYDGDTAPSRFMKVIMFVSLVVVHDAQHCAASLWLIDLVQLQLQGP